MKLHMTSPGPDQHLFTGYGEGYISVNNQRYEHPVLVSPGGVEAWNARDFDTLSAGHFEALIAHEPEIVVLGTGGRLRFPRPELTRALAAASIGFEVMDTKAACRTYNILMSEGRQVLAAILI